LKSSETIQVTIDWLGAISEPIIEEIINTEETRRRLVSYNKPGEFLVADILHYSIDEKHKWNWKQTAQTIFNLLSNDTLAKNLDKNAISQFNTFPDIKTFLDRFKEFEKIGNELLKADAHDNIIQFAYQTFLLSYDPDHLVQILTGSIRKMEQICASKDFASAFISGIYGFLLALNKEGVFFPSLGCLLSPYSFIDLRELDDDVQMKEILQKNTQLIALMRPQI
jgi:hypothetical protein